MKCFFTLILGFSLLIFSCKFHNITILSVNNWNYELSRWDMVSYSLKVNGYQNKLSYFDGFELNEIIFIFKDSAVVYMSLRDFIPHDNKKNIDNKIEFDYNTFKEKSSITDTVILCGIDSKNRIWKNIKISDVNIGYANVDPSLEPKFNKILRSFKIKKRKK